MLLSQLLPMRRLREHGRLSAQRPWEMAKPRTVRKVAEMRMGVKITKQSGGDSL